MEVELSDRGLRVWSVGVRKRDKCCVICGTIKGREAHHLYSKAHHPNEAYDLDNGITLCNHKGNRCHTTFHNEFMGSTRRSCTPSDFSRFRSLMAYSAQIAAYVLIKKVSNNG